MATNYSLTQDVVDPAARIEPNVATLEETKAPPSQQCNSARGSLAAWRQGRGQPPQARRASRRQRCAAVRPRVHRCRRAQLLTQGQRESAAASQHWRGRLDQLGCRRTCSVARSCVSVRTRVRSDSSSWFDISACRQHRIRPPVLPLRRQTQSHLFADGLCQALLGHAQAGRERRRRCVLLSSAH